MGGKKPFRSVMPKVGFIIILQVVGHKKSSYAKNQLLLATGKGGCNHPIKGPKLKIAKSRNRDKKSGKVAKSTLNFTRKMMVTLVLR